MAQIETWLNQDITQAVKVRYLDGNLFSQDNAGNLIGVKLTRDGVDYSGGGTVSANVIRSDGGTVAVSGALSENNATVILPQAAYAVPGVVSVIIKLTVNSEVTTIAAVVANVYKSSTDTAIDPGTIIPSIQTLINEIQTAVATIPPDYSSLVSAVKLADENARQVYNVTSVNLFDYSDCELGDYNSSGVPITSTTVMRTKTPVQITGTHTISNYKCRRFFYDASMRFIERSDSANDWDTPDGAAYVLFSIAKTVYDAHTDIMVNVGTTQLAYQAFSIVPQVFDLAIEQTQIAEYAKNALKWSGVGINNTNLTTYVPSGDFDNLTDGLVYAVSVDSADALNKPVSDMIGTFFSLKYDRNSATNVAQVFIGRDEVFCFRYRIGAGTWTVWSVLDANRIKRISDLFWLIQADKTSVNLFDYADCELGNISSTGKDQDSETGMRTKHLVPFSGAEIASSCNSRKVYYDAFGNFISRSASNSLDTVPDGAAYVRFVIAASDYEQTVMMNVGGSVLSYQAFKLYTVTDAGSMDDLKYYSELYKTFKRVGVIGDSLSVGYSGHTGTYPKIIERNLAYSWPKYIGRDADSYWLNFGEHGMNVLTWCSSATRGKVQMEAENNKCQCYIICLGVNDSTPTGTRHVDVGQASDIVDNPDTVATTYYGGFARIIQLVKRRNPYARIFCSTIPDEQRSTANRTRYKPYNDAVRYIAGTYYTTNDNVFLLDIAADYGDLFNTPGSPLYIEQVGDNRVSHFSSVGYQMISKIYETAISKVMLQNQPKFMDIMYIPCDTAEPTEDTMVGYEETDNT